MAVARYEINGKFNNSAIKQAQVNLARLQKSFSAAALAMKGFAIAKIMQVGSAAINGATEAFKEQETQLARLNNAVKTNASLTAGAFGRLRAEADKLTSSGASIFSGEEITRNQAFLASMKLNENQIKNVMKAATNMASAGVMPLDMAVKTLSKTYDGNLGKLKDLNPAIAGLTKQQLENGDAVAAISLQYAGFNEALANTEAGKARQFANTFDDVRKSLGGIISEVKNITFAHLAAPLKRFSGWLDTNRDKVVNFFRYLPEIAMSSGALVKNILRKLFSWDFLSKAFVTELNFCGTVLKNLLNSWIAYIKLVGSVIWEPLHFAFENIVYGIQGLFANVVNFFVDKINGLVEQVNKVAAFFGKDGIKELGRVNTENNKKPENNIAKNIKEAFDKATTTWKDSGKEIAQEFVDSWKTIGSEFSGELADFTKEFENIISRANPKTENVQGAEGETGSVGGASEVKSAGSPFSGLLDNVKQAGGALGWLANVVEKAVSTGDPMAALFVVISEALSIILDGVIAILAPVVDSILSPLFGILRVLGKFLGTILIPVLSMLEPIIRLVSKAFLFLYNNVVVPIGNGLMVVFNLLHNVIAGFINGLSWLVKKITFGRVDLGHTNYRSLDQGKLQKIQETDLAFEGRQALKSGSATSSGNAAGGAASAVAAKPTVINIAFNHSYVNGDAREIALMLRKEIREAEAMGY